MELFHRDEDARVGDINDQQWDRDGATPIMYAQRARSAFRGDWNGSTVTLLLLWFGLHCGGAGSGEVKGLGKGRVWQ